MRSPLRDYSQRGEAGRRSTLDRARHALGDGADGTHRRLELRSKDCRWDTGRDTRRCRRSRRISWRQRRRERLMLDVHDLCGGYGQAPVLHNVKMRLDRGETVAVLGPNGAGKSPLLAALTATLPVRSGRAEMSGHDLIGMVSHRIVAEGLALIPEGRHVFAPITLQNKLLLGSIRLQKNK